MLIIGCGNEVWKTSPPAPRVSERPRGIWSVAGARTRKAGAILSSWRWYPDSRNSIAGSSGKVCFILKQRSFHSKYGIILVSNEKLTCPWILYISATCFKWDSSKVLSRAFWDPIVYAGQDHLVSNLNPVRLGLEECIQILWWSVTGTAGGPIYGIDWPICPLILKGFS